MPDDTTPVDTGGSQLLDEPTPVAARRSKGKRKPGDLLPSEIWWRDRQPWLQDKGYILRPRFRPGWVPSWSGNKKPWSSSEDGQVSISRQIMDATRLSDGKMVALKKVSKVLNPEESTIGEFLSAASLSADPDNYTVPIYEVLQVPEDDNIVLLVMPFLRNYNNPKFQTIGEAVDFFNQTFKGLQFLHKNLVAHRDVNPNNLMMDAASMFPEGFHPHAAYQERRPDFKGRAKEFSRTQKPPRYYFIDFGLSCKYDSLLPPPREERVWGGDRSVPEYQDDPGFHDPFPVDVYNMGNLIKVEFIEKMYGFEFMEALVADMTQTDPTKRPTMDVVVAQFDKIKERLTTWTLRTRAAKKTELVVMGIFRGARHVVQQTGYLLRGTPPVPAR